MRQYPGGGASALFFHPHPQEFATQNKKQANASGLARERGVGGWGGGEWTQLELTDALFASVFPHGHFEHGEDIEDEVFYQRPVILFPRVFSGNGGSEETLANSQSHLQKYWRI